MPWQATAGRVYSCALVAGEGGGEDRSWVLPSQLLVFPAGKLPGRVTLM